MLLSPVSWHTRFCLFPPRVCFPVLCQFWWLYGGANGDLLQEGLCHTQVCCTQSLCPCSSLLLTCTSQEDPQTLFSLSLCEVSGSWCTQGTFEPSEHLWWICCLILSVILRFLPSCWGFFFALDVGYLLNVTPALCSPHSSTTQLLLQCLLLCCTIGPYYLSICVYMSVPVFQFIPLTF